MRLINAALVEQLLSPALALEAAEAAAIAAHRGEVRTPLRQVLPTQADGSHDSALFLMPGFGDALGVYGCKLISLHHHNPAQGLPAIQGYVMLFDADNGSPIALVDGASITAKRTAAASAAASRALAKPNATSLGLFGTGVQADSHLAALQAIFPLSELRVWARDRAKAEAFAQRAAAQYGIDTNASSAEDAAGCDIVCTLTGASQPILKGEWLKSGSHINLVGAHTADSREADAEVMRRGNIYVDQISAAEREAGDILLAQAEGTISADINTAINGELGALLQSERPTRLQGDARISVYKSLGFTAQDLYAAYAVYSAAKAQGLGSEF